GVVGVAAVGVDGELGAGKQRDLGADVGADAVDLGDSLGVALVDVGVVTQDACCGHVEAAVLIGGAGVGHGHGGVVAVGCGDCDRRAGVGALAFHVRVAEGVGGRLLSLHVALPVVGVVGVAAVGVDRELGARRQRDLGADVGADAVDGTYCLGV